MVLQSIAVGNRDFLIISKTVSIAVSRCKQVSYWYVDNASENLILERLFHFNVVLACTAP